MEQGKGREEIGRWRYRRAETRRDEKGGEGKERNGKAGREAWASISLTACLGIKVVNLVENKVMRVLGKVTSCFSLTSLTWRPARVK